MTGPLTGPHAPGLRRPPPGVTLRRATLEDVGAVAELIRTCERDRIGAAETRAEDLRLRWLGADLSDTLLVEDAGRLVAYAEFHADTDPWSETLDLFVDGRVHPDHLGRGLASFLLGRAEDRARAVRERHAARTGSDQTTVLRTVVVDADARARAFFRRRGFVPVRHFLTLRLDLHAPPPPPVWPDGVACRTVGPADLPAVHAAHQRAFADLPTHLPADLDAWREARIDRDPAHDWALWFVAESADDDIVGVCLTRPATPESAEIGYVRDLGVVPAWRRRGVGMALLRTALHAFRDRGLTGAALEVDDVSLDGAVALYQAAGMQVVRRTDVLELPLA